MKVTNSLIALSFSIGLISTSLALPAQAAEPIAQESTIESIIAASPVAVVNFERPTVSTSHTEIAVPDPVVVVQSDSKPESASTVSKTPQASTKTENTSTNISTPVSRAITTTTPVASGKGSIIVAAALAQVGVNQDCTALVSNSLAGSRYPFSWMASWLPFTRISNL